MRCLKLHRYPSELFMLRFWFYFVQPMMSFPRWKPCLDNCRMKVVIVPIASKWKWNEMVRFFLFTLFLIISTKKVKKLFNQHKDILRCLKLHLYPSELFMLRFNFFISFSPWYPFHDGNLAWTTAEWRWWLCKLYRNENEMVRCFLIYVILDHQHEEG